MNKEFVNIAEKIVEERGKNILNDTKLTKAFFMDYGHGEYKNEINLLIKIIELGYSKKITDSEDINVTKIMLIKQLKEEQFLNDRMADSIIKLLIGLLRDKKYLKEIDKIQTKKINVNMNSEIKESNVKNSEEFVKSQKTSNNTTVKKQKKLLEEDIVKRSSEIWVCGRCKTSNKFALDFCKKCGKEFNPPL